MKARPVRVEGDVAFIPLTKGNEAVIDASDLPLVKDFNWCTNVGASRSIYAARADCSSGKQRIVYLHRVLMGDPDGMVVDHIDGNGLNNRRSNLRLATRAENNRNQRLSRANSTGIKGVSWNEQAGRWRAMIGLGGKLKFLGNFDSQEAARAAYKTASEKNHGEFGRTA